MSAEKKQTIELLPKGKFIISRESGKIMGRFSMNVLDRFCELKNIENYADLLDKIVRGMAVGDYGDLLLFAMQDYWRDKEAECDMKNRRDVFDLVDEVFEKGIADAEFDNLIYHAIGRIADVKNAAEALLKLTAEQLAEKKSGSENSLTDGSSGNDATNQG